MPYAISKNGKKKWKWGNIERNTKKELAQAVYGIWAKNGKKGSFSKFWDTGKSE